MPTMKAATLTLRVVALCLVLGSAAESSAQTSEQPSTSETGNSVASMAEKTLNAIRSRDTGFVSRLVDPSGIGLGVDTPNLSAPQFKKELREKRGAYCVIFADCHSKNRDQSHKDSSLRGLLMSGLVSMTVHGVEGAPQETAVDVRESRNPNHVLFTLFYRRIGNRWALRQIEYF